MTKKIITAFDIGGTKIRVANFSRTRILRYKEINTPKNFDGFKKTLRGLIKTLMLNTRCSTLNIAIGAAGIIKGGVLVKSLNIPYIKNLDFKKLFKGIAVEVDNDARCFLRGEYVIGNARKAKNAFGLTLGTGIGRAYGEFKNKKPAIRPVKEFEYPENFEKEYQKLRDTGNNNKLAEFLAEKLTPVIKPYAPEILVIGGGVSLRKDFLARLSLAFKKNGLKSKVVKSKLGSHSALLGASLLF